jgi:hypothetical protein
VRAASQLELVPRCARCGAALPALPALAAVTLRLAVQAEEALEAFGSMRLAVPEAMARGLRATAEQLPGLAQSLRCHASLCVPVRPAADHGEPTCGPGSVA